MTRSSSFLLMLSMGCAIMLSGCASAILGGAALTGMTAAQERTMGDAVDDTTLSARIQSRLIQADISKLYANVNTNIHESRVMLTGDVQDERLIAEASRLVWEVEGVREVINEMQVVNEEPISALANDQWINAQLDSTLLITKGIRSINYSSRVVNGSVYLLGVAQDQAELDRVINVTRRIKGVKKVVNHVMLKHDPRRARWLGHPITDTPPTTGRSSMSDSVQHDGFGDFPHRHHEEHDGDIVSLKNEK